MKLFYKIILLVFILSSGSAHAQSGKDLLIKSKVDSTKNLRPITVRDSAKNILAADTVTIKKHSPRKATFRSLVLPGWGQAYNNERWKIPLVYGVIGTPAGFWIYNNTWYKRTKKAFEIRITSDTASFPLIHEKLQGVSTEALRFYRNDFRKNRDYSFLYFLIAWGLNVADATVFGHLKDFDVSDDLSFKVKPGYSPVANTTGLSLVLAVKSPSQRNSVITK